MLPVIITGLSRHPWRECSLARDNSWACVALATEVSKMLNLKVCSANQQFCMQAAMECAKEMGCKASIVDFVMPLGTTVNMNGTALYEATTVIFLAQVCVSNLADNPQGDISAQTSLSPVIPVNLSLAS